VAYIEIDNNKELYYHLIAGDESKPYLVFLHEGLGCVKMWGGFPELLCKMTGCRGLIYDRLGYGKSSALTQQRTVHYLHDYALNELPAVLDSVIPHTPFILIGHSDGGSIGLLYSAQRTQLLKGLITEAAHVFVETETITGIDEAVSAWEDGKLNGLMEFHGDKTETIFNAWSATWRASWFKLWNIEYILPSIEAPLLVIQGSDDQYGSEEQVRSIVTKSSGLAIAEIIEDCGHAPHNEAQKTVLALMSNFIDEINEA
jgi:pimeloyl-ACP methyl ester carboxylesterase